MKKYYVFLVSAMIFGASAIAQTVAPANNLKYRLDIQKVEDFQKAQSNNHNKATETGWLSPVSKWESEGASFAGPSYLRLWPDSTVVIVPEDGSEPFNQSMSLAGSVMQPDDGVYELQTGWLMNRFDDYTCDSARFTYGYIRLEDSMMVGGSNVEIIDTLVVHFYRSTNLDDWYLNGSTNKFMIPMGDNFSVEELGPTDVMHTDTIFMDRSWATDTVRGETISIGQVRLAIPDPINKIPANPMLTYDNTVALSYVYKPMQPYVAGDTLISFDDNNPGSKVFNQFGGISYGNDASGIVQADYFNNSFVSNSQVRYGQTFGTVIKGYLPTVAFFGWTRDFFVDIDFHVTVEDPASLTDVKDQLGLSAYPNPAAIGTEVMVKLENAVSENNLTIQLTDLLGNVISNEFVSLGNGEYSVPTMDMASGVYLINVTADNASSTMRIVVGD